ncbi:hypothetical protein [Streptomyces yerevanensis]|uniref:hypothetical protein n=1 Tax=Streptomyces yerevanensis TaxID=66378 RepID=UPI00068BDD8B|nr:hypothetical protein [Streptomyces yerevanensis]
MGPSAILRAEGLGFAAQFVVGDDAVAAPCLGMYEPGAWIARAVPKPLLMIAEAAETVIPADIQPAAYERALPPKKLVMLPGGHFDAYAEVDSGEVSASDAHGRCGPDDVLAQVQVSVGDGAARAGDAVDVDAGFWQVQELEAVEETRGGVPEDA